MHAPWGSLLLCHPFSPFLRSSAQVDVTVAPLSAAILMKFQEQSEWSMSDLAAALKVGVQMEGAGRGVRGLAWRLLRSPSWATSSPLFCAAFAQATPAAIKSRMAVWRNMGILVEDPIDRFTLHEEGGGGGAMEMEPGR